MTEELQSLLERIRTEGVERAEAEAASIVTEAKERAGRIVAEAEAEADGLRRRAEADAQASRERAEKALEQAARDFLLALQKSIEAVLRGTLRDTVATALTPDVVADMLVRLADAYAAHDMNESRVDVLLAAKDRDRIAALVMQKYRDLVNQGLTLRADERLDKGFKVSFVDGDLYHDFSLSALAEALAPVLKPALGEIVGRAALEQD
jgi:V/A-type H+/Na+-transporting ATPase subunit E